MTKKIDQTLIKQVIDQASASPRLRSNFNFHPAMEDPVQRLLIGFKKGTYVQPHHHPAEDKWEMLVAVHGEVCFVVFEADGSIKDKVTLSQGQSSIGLEIPAGTWHTIYPISEESAFLEMKRGPYTPSEPTDFAAWAPSEGEPDVESFLQWIENAQIGDSYKPS